MTHFIGFSGAVSYALSVSSVFSLRSLLPFIFSGSSHRNSTTLVAISCSVLTRFTFHVGTFAQQTCQHVSKGQNVEYFCRRPVERHKNSESCLNEQFSFKLPSWSISRTAPNRSSLTFLKSKSGKRASALA